MSLTPFVFDATPENFDALILGNSLRGLVLAHFWSPKAAPCLLLMPRLVKLAAVYGGRFLLVMVNTEELGQRARNLGVTSVPTVKFFLHGNNVHTLHGAENDESFHAALGQFLANDQDALRISALKLHKQGDTENAIAVLARIAVEDPLNLAVTADLAKLLTLAKRPHEALALLTSLPAKAQMHATVAPLLAHLELIEAAKQQNTEEEIASDPAAAQFTQAARALSENRLEEALMTLLELARHAPTYRNDIGRRAMLALFGLLGKEDALTRQFRARLAELAI